MSLSIQPPRAVMGSIIARRYEFKIWNEQAELICALLHCALTRLLRARIEKDDPGAALIAEPVQIHVTRASGFDQRQLHGLFGLRQRHKIEQESPRLGRRLSDARSNNRTANRGGISAGEIESVESELATRFQDRSIQSNQQNAGKRARMQARRVWGNVGGCEII